MLPLPGAGVGRVQAETQRGAERGRGGEGERDVTLKGTSSRGGAAGGAACADSGAPGWVPPASPAQTKYPALRGSEKFLALVWPGLSGLNSPSSWNRGCCLPSACSSCSSPQELKLIGRLIQAWRVGHWPWEAAKKREGVRARDPGQTRSRRLSESKRQSETGIAIKAKRWSDGNKQRETEERPGEQTFPKRDTRGREMRRKEKIRGDSRAD